MTTSATTVPTVTASGSRAPAVAGLAGTAALTACLAVLSTLWTRVPFVPVNIAQRLVRVTSGQVNSFFIDRLGHWAQRLALLGTCLGFVVAGLLAGIAVRAFAREGTRGSALWWISFLPFWALSVGLYVTYPQSLGRVPFALVTVPLYVAAGGAARWVHERITSPPPRKATELTRRFFLRSAMLGAGAIAFGVADLGRLLYRRRDPGLDRLHLANVTEVTLPSPAPGDAAFDDIAGLTPLVTSTAHHYVVDEELIDPDIDPLAWRLRVGGLVDHPLELTYDELKALPAVERYQTLECISNRIGQRLISTAKWTGVPLHLILERAGVQAAAVEVVFSAAGGYSDSLPAAKAMDPSTLIATGMNGNVLPRAHGFPARVLSTGTYGMKNPKWLVAIDVVDRPYQGFWEQRGWVKAAIVNTGSRIDVPIDHAVLPATVTVAGVAFAGDRGISKVEVSTDDGATWNVAALRSELSPVAWRQWRYDWAPEKGDHVIFVRATDGTGATQTMQVAGTFPSGVTGYDGIEVSRQG
jgi:DMSO/TMAO reductase YedYZ molybdopterin-dependent catalytic subunit